MSGRSLILILIVFSAATGLFFYRTLQQSPQFKHLATEQMASEYTAYVQTFQKTDRLLVAQTEAAKFYAPMNGSWKFELQDKTLVATVPKLESDPIGQPATPEVFTAAKSEIEKSLLIWLEDKYHTKKDLQVDVRFQDLTNP